MSTTERSDRAYEHGLEAGQKYDYFVTGVALTLVLSRNAARHHAHRVERAHNPDRIGRNPAAVRDLRPQED